MDNEMVRQHTALGLRALGWRLLAFATGERTRGAVEAWACGDASPSPEQARRLAYLADLIHELQERVPQREHTRAWLLSSRRDADEASALELIRDGHGDEVLAAARQWAT